MGLSPPAVPRGDYTPCRAIFFLNFFFDLIFFSETCTYGVYNPIRAFFFRYFSGTFFFGGLHPPAVPPGGLHPPAAPWGTTPPCRANFFFSIFFSTWIFFLKHAHMEFISRLGQFFFRDFFGNFFFLALHPPCSHPWGLHPPAVPLGDYIPCRAIFFSIFSDFFFWNMHIWSL